MSKSVGKAKIPRKRNKTPLVSTPTSILGKPNVPKISLTTKKKKAPPCVLDHTNSKEDISKSTTATQLTASMLEKKAKNEHLERENQKKKYASHPPSCSSSSSVNSWKPGLLLSKHTVSTPVTKICLLDDTSLPPQTTSVSRRSRTTLGKRKRTDRSSKSNSMLSEKIVDDAPLSKKIKKENTSDTAGGGSISVDYLPPSVLLAIADKAKLRAATEHKIPVKDPRATKPIVVNTQGIFEKKEEPKKRSRTSSSSGGGTGSSNNSSSSSSKQKQTSDRKSSEGDTKKSVKTLSIARDMMLGGHGLAKELNNFDSIIQELSKQEAFLEHEEAEFVNTFTPQQRERLGAALRKKNPTQDDLLLLWQCASDIMAKLKEIQTFGKAVRQELKKTREQMTGLVDLTSALARHHWKTVGAIVSSYDDHKWGNPHKETPRGESLGTVF